MEPSRGACSALRKHRRMVGPPRTFAAHHTVTDDHFSSISSGGSGRIGHKATSGDNLDAGIFDYLILWSGLPAGNRFDYSRVAEWILRSGGAFAVVCSSYLSCGGCCRQRRGVFHVRLLGRRCDVRSSPRGSRRHRVRGCGAKRDRCLVGTPAAVVRPFRAGEGHRGRWRGGGGDV